MTQRPIEEVLADSTPAWLEVPGVVGTGIGLCDSIPCIRVLVERMTDQVRQRIPERVEGHPVDIQVTGRIRPLDGSPEP